MEQFKHYADERNTGWCIFCGGEGETRDHAPSRVFLDEPYPESLTVVPSCRACNNSFSRDEEYVACLLECALSGSVEAAALRRKIAKILGRSPALAAKLESAKTLNDGQPIWSVEHDRVDTVVLKLARGHIAFEQNSPQLDDPSMIWHHPLHSMTDMARNSFFRGAPGLAGWPEAGSRTMIRFVEGSIDGFPWITVQPGRYRYMVSPDSSLVRLVVAEYLVAEVAWD